MESLIHLPTLAAVSKFASSDPVRPQINGVHLTIDPNGVTYVATDGHRLAARRVAHHHGTPNALLGSWTLPTASCAAIKLPKRLAKEPARAYGTLTQSGRRLTLLHEGNGHTFEPIDLAFPDWRRIIPASVSGTTSANFNGDYLASVDDFRDALQLGMKSSKWNDENAAVFTFADDANAFCLVMPMRNHGTAAEWTVPAWVNAPVISPAPAATAANTAEPVAA